MGNGDGRDQGGEGEGREHEGWCALKEPGKARSRELVTGNPGRMAGNGEHGWKGETGGVVDLPYK